MESSSGWTALVTVAPKCFEMDSVHMGFDWIAGSWERKTKKVRVPSLASTFLQPKSPLALGTVQKRVANESALKGTSTYCRDLHLPLRHLRLQNRYAYVEFRWAIRPLIVVGKVPKESGKLHSYIQTAADAARNHSLIAVLFVGNVPVGSLPQHPCKAANSDPW